MTDKCKRRMNGREGYITTEITQSRGMGEEEEEGPEKGERLLGCERSWEFPSSGEGSFLPGTLGRLILCICHLQNKPSPHQNPTFGHILYKFIVMSPIRKPRPYTTQYCTHLFRNNVNITMIVQCKPSIFHYFISNLLRSKWAF